MAETEDNRLYNFDPVVVEYYVDGDFWIVHRENCLPASKKQSCDLIPFETARRLENSRLCTGCFDLK